MLVIGATAVTAVCVALVIWRPLCNVIDGLAWLAYCGVLAVLVYMKTMYSHVQTCFNFIFTEMEKCLPPSVVRDDQSSQLLILQAASSAIDLLTGTLQQGWLRITKILKGIIINIINTINRSWDQSARFRLS